MGERRRLALLLAALALVAGITGAVTVTMLYNATVKWQREILQNVAESQVQAITDTEKVERATNPTISNEELLVIISRDLAHHYSQLPDFGATGEVLIGHKQDDYVRYLASSHWQSSSSITAFRAGKHLATPMRKAIDGQRGTLIGPDYRGIEVLAAFAPVPSLGWGVVAKIDLAEIRRPFTSAAFAVALVALLAIILLAISYARATNPLLREIAASELRFRTLAESTEAISWEYDPLADRWTYIAPQVEHLLGYAPDEWLNLQWWIARLHADDQSWVPEFFAEHARRGEFYNFEYRFICKNGNLVWIRECVGLEMGQDGPTMLRGYMFDITDRKQAEVLLQELNEQLNSTNEELSASNGELSATNAELIAANEEIAAFNEELTAINEQMVATNEELESTCLELEHASLELKESEERYHTLFREMLEGFALHEIICDDDGNPIDYRFEAVNPAFERMTGLKAVDIIGKTVLTVLPSTEQYWIETYGKVALTGKPAHFENYSEAQQKHFEINAYRPAPMHFACIFNDITGRKHAEATQRETLEMLDAVLKHTLIMMIYLDAEFNFIWVNHAYAETCNRDPSFFRGKNHFQLYPSAEYQAIFQRVVDTGEPFYAAAVPLEFETQPQRGVSYWDLSLIAVTDASKQTKGLVFTMAEATGRVAADQALRESERRLSEAQNMAQLGYWHWDIHTGKVEWSDQVYRIFHLDPASFTPQIDSIMELSPWPEDHERDKELIQKAMESHENGEYEQRFLRPDNSIGYYHSTFHGTYNDAGNLVAINGTVQDITERKIVEEELKASEQKYRELFENAPAGIFRTNSQGEVLSINSAMARMLGLDSTQDTIQRFNHLETNLYVHAERRAEFIRQMREQGSVEGFEYEANTADGRVVWLSMNARISQLEDDGNFIIEGFTMDITERKRTEDALQESEAKYRQLIELASEGVWADDYDNVTTFVNPQMAEMLGYRPEEILGHRNVEFMYPEDLIVGDDGDLVQRSEIGDARRRGEKSAYEQRFKRADGTELWCMVSGTPIIGSDGQYLGSFGMLTDITERKQIEKTLTESELRYRRLFESAKDGILILDAETGMVDDVNPYLIDMLGYSYEQLQGKEIWELGFLKDIVASRDNFYELQQQEYIRYDDLPLETVDGQRIDVEFVSNVYQVNNRKVIQCNIRDISERKRAEAALYQANREWETTFETITDMITVHDADFNILRANKAAKESLYLSNIDEITHIKCFRCYHGTDKPPEGCPSCDCLRTGLPAVQEVYEPHLDQYVEIRAIPTFDKDGRLGGLIHVVRNITERKLAEKERAALEDQLRQVHKMEAIGTLAGGIAHDFNNLLFAILGNAELALDEIDAGSQAYANIQALVVAGNRAKGLVQQILAFSRKTRQELVPLEIVKIIKEVLKMLRATFPSTIEIQQRMEQISALVIADPTEMHQVLMNLCTNAAIAMDQGPGVLGITLRETEISPESAQVVLGLAPGLYIELSVSDTGHGIAPEIQSRIFEPFFTTRETGKGTGLGLSVVHGIVTKLGGTITVDSKVDTGTRFTVYLPAQRGAVGSAELEDAQLPRGTAHILIVDDESNVLAVEQQMLESLGYRVTCCASAVEALALLRRDPQGIDVLLTDQTMPRQTGIELARDMFALRPDLPVILCTGYSEAVTPETIAAFGIKECLYKPVHKRELAEVIQRVLPGENAAEA